LAGFTGMALPGGDLVVHERSPVQARAIELDAGSAPAPQPTGRDAPWKAVAGHFTFRSGTSCAGRWAAIGARRSRWALPEGSPHSLVYKLDFRGANMKIQIAGPGCANCRTTEQRVINACAELNLAADISHITDYNEIARLGVLRTPGVIIDGEIVVMGRVPSVAELKKLIAARAAH
jgi:small redox-active disulfide protein 2